MKIFIIGPMCNLTQKGCLMEAETFVRSEGHEPLLLRDVVYDNNCVEQNILLTVPELLKCDGIYLLRGSKSDKLSRILWNMCEVLDKHVFLQIADFTAKDNQFDITQFAVKAEHN